MFIFGRALSRLRYLAALCTACWLVACGGSDGADGDASASDASADSSDNDSAVGSADFGFASGWPPIAVVGEPYLHALAPRGGDQLTVVEGPQWLALQGDAMVGVPPASALGVHTVTVRLLGSGGFEGQSVEASGAILVLVSKDADQDGLDNDQELALGTNPSDADSDRDGTPDPEEVGDPSAPTDTDSDGLIDALEGRLSDNDQDGVADQDDPDRGGPDATWQLTAVQFIPQVIANDGVDAATAEIRIDGEGIEAVWLGRSQQEGTPLGIHSLDRLYVDGQPVGIDRIQLYDDGTHSDRIANDSIYSRGGFTTDLPGLYVSGQLDEWELDEVTVIDASGETTRRVWDGYKAGNSVFRSGVLSLGFIEAASVQTPVPLADGVFGVSHALNLVAPLEATEVAEFLQLGPNPDMPAAARRAMTAVHALGYEPSITYFITERPSHGGAAGRQQAAQNQVEGIGRTVFDNLESYGADAELLAVLALDFSTNGPILHETLHQWAVFLDPSFGFQSTHWGIAGTYGQLGGFDADSLVDNGDGTYTADRFGTFANGGDGQPYSEWELYLMGLLPADQVPPMPVPTDAAVVSNTAQSTTFTASGIQTVTVEDVVAKHGPRIPAAGQAQSDFRGLFVVLSQRPLTAAELSYASARAELFGAAAGDGSLLSFEEATGGRGTMDTSIPLP